jgi:hypothetical protein
LGASNLFVPHEGKILGSPILIAANVGDVSFPDSHTVSIVDIARRERIAERRVVPAHGPHGLDLDLLAGRLLYACDAGVLITLDDQGPRSDAMDKL